MRILLMVLLLLASFNSFGQDQHGLASYYGKRFHGRTMANGHPFDMRAMTAAHKTLPFGTVVRVTDRLTGKTVDVTITDRGPYIGKRIIDLSRGAAEKLGFKDRGITNVIVEIVTGV